MGSCHDVALVSGASCESLLGSPYLCKGYGKFLQGFVSNTLLTRGLCSTEAASACRVLLFTGQGSSLMSHFLCRVSAQRSTFSCRRLVLSLMMRASSDWSLEVVTTLQNKATTSFRFLQMPSAESSSEAVQRCHCNQLSHEASHCKCAFHKNLHFTGKFDYLHCHEYLQGQQVQRAGKRLDGPNALSKGEEREGHY